MKYFYLKLLISLCFLLLYTIPAKSCGCEVEAPFLKIAPATPLIVVVEIKDHLTFEYLEGEEVPMSMSVEIIRVLKGIETRTEITVWGNNGLMCRPYLSIFDIGSKWVMAFGENPTDGHERALSSDYAISDCGEYFLEVRNGVATGFIDELQHQQTTIRNLAYKLNMIHRQEGRIDELKCTFIKDLHFSKIDTIAVFETYKINDKPHTFNMKANAIMVTDNLYGSFYGFMKQSKIYRQVFIYWQSNGTTFVKQIDNYMGHEVQRVDDTDFFDIYLSYKKPFSKEKLHLPNRNKKAKKRSKKSKRHEKPNQKTQTYYAKIDGNVKGVGMIEAQPTYTKHSLQFFMSDHVFLREYDSRLFEKSYNRKHYKKNKKSLAYIFLEILKEETDDVALENEKSRNLFKRYKRLLVSETLTP